MRDVEGGDLSRRVPVDDRRRGGAAVAGVQPHAGTAVARPTRRSAPSTSAWPARSRRRPTICPRRTRRWRSSTACSTTCAATTRPRCGWRRWGSWRRSWRTRSARRCRRCRGTCSWRCCSAICRPALRERLEVSAREIERISTIVRDYLDSTRPLEPERKPTALPRLLDEAVELVRGVGPRATARRVDARSIPDVGDDRHRPGPAAPDRGQPAVQRARRRRPQGGRVVAHGARGSRGRGAHHGQRHRHTASRPTTCGGSSSRSTRPRGAARGPGWAWRSAAQLTAALGGTISVESKPGQGLDLLRARCRVQGRAHRAAETRVAACRQRRASA